MCGLHRAGAPSRLLPVTGPRRQQQAAEHGVHSCDFHVTVQCLNTAGSDAHCSCPRSGHSKCSATACMGILPSRMRHGGKSCGAPSAPRCRGPAASWPPACLPSSAAPQQGWRPAGCAESAAPMHCSPALQRCSSSGHAMVGAASGYQEGIVLLSQCRAHRADLEPARRSSNLMGTQMCPALNL